MRVTFVSTMAGANWGGSEELWSQSASRLKKEGHHVGASVWQWLSLSPKISALADQGIDLFFRPMPGKTLPARILHKVRQNFGGNQRLFDWIRDQRPDLVVISQGAFDDGLPFMNYCREARLPFVALVHCNCEMWWPADGLSQELLMAYRAARNVYCVSQANLALLERQLGAKLSHASVVWNPCNVSTTLRPEWPVDDGMARFACVGRLDPRAKGQDILFEVLARDVWRSRSVEVNLYGGGEYEQTLKNLAQHFGLKQIHFRGHVSGVADIWRQNHLLVLPSRYEGLPLALVEAMWCARPAVVTDIGGNAELCLDNETGFVAEFPSINSLGDALERAWQRREDWHQMGAQGRARVERIIPKDAIADFCRQLLN